MTSKTHSAGSQEESAGFHPERLLAPSMTELLKGACREHAGRMAYSCVLPNGASASLSYEAIGAASDALAFFLREELGLAPGDVVAIQAPNVLGFPIAAYGVLKAGLVFTGINPLFTVPETNYQLRDSGAKALFVIDLFGNRLAEAVADTQVRHVIRLSVADFFPAPQRLLITTVMKHVQRRVPKMSVPSVSLREALQKGRSLQGGRDVQSLAEARDLDDPAIYQYTGGTTGRSKGAQLTERNLLANITQQDAFTGELLRQQRSDNETNLLVLPLYHVYALAIGAMHGMRTGTHAVLAPQPRPLNNLKPAFERFEVTMLPGINTLFAGLLQEEWFVQNPPASLKWCFSGAAPLSPAVRERWREVTGCEIHEGYGLTEGTCIVSASPLDDRAKPGSVGMPIPGTEIRVVGEAGAAQPAGSPGEIWVRGPQVMKGYLGRGDGAGETFEDGWLKTGDIGYLDADGFLYIVDRKKDMLLVSGFNVYPAEIEAALAEHPQVAESAVVGVMDQRAGEIPWAFVVPRGKAPSEADLKAHCEDRLTHYKHPRRFILVDELPKSPVGKLLRRELRERARREAEGAAAPVQE